MSKLQTADAKAFAKAEIEEHESIKAKLNGQGFDYPVKATGGAAATGDRATYQVSAGPAPLPPEAAGMIVLDHEVADQCIANYRKEFDECAAKKHADLFFVGHQLVTHMTLLDQVQTFQRHASPKMQPVLAEGLKVIGTHIATLKKLKESLDAAKHDPK